jgi:peptidyl-tRNA hydrolase, PTH1 family
MDKIKVFIGLGNPENEYINTYHNVGFHAIEFFRKHKRVSSKLYLSGAKAMNLSGSFVSAVMRKFKLSPKEILIIHDDNDIELGSFKFSYNRSAAGHKGVQNIIDTLQTKQFWRLRIGIGKSKKKPHVKANSFVLTPMTKHDKKHIYKVFQNAIFEFEEKQHQIVP